MASPLGPLPLEPLAPPEEEQEEEGAPSRLSVTARESQPPESGAPRWGRRRKHVIWRCSREIGGSRGDVCGCKCGRGNCKEHDKRQARR